MKIVCICDRGVEEMLMQQMKKLPGCEVELFSEESLKDVKSVVVAMRIAEEKGPDGMYTSPEMLEAVKDAEAIIVHIAPVGKAVLDAAPNLKYVGVCRTGVENVDLEACKERGIQVFNAEGRNSVAVADMTVAMMICEMRNIARGYAALASGKWVKIFPNLMYCRDMNRCTVGIIGVGKIGTMVAERLKGFGCKILGCDAFLPEEEVLARGCDEVVGMEELLKRSDFVTIHMRHGAGEPPLLGADELALMKPTAILVNCARSGLVDTDAMIDALANGRLGGAAIDVFDIEPLPEDHPLRTLPNVTLTPHAAGTTVDAFANSVTIIFDQFSTLLAGEEPKNRMV